MKFIFDRLMFFHNTQKEAALIKHDFKGRVDKLNKQITRLNTEIQRSIAYDISTAVKNKK